jgi:methionyl-tRNA formyltransferase
MRIVLFCATRRGYRFLQKLAQLAPEAKFVVFSFKEDAWEPPFLEDIRELTGTIGGQFFETKQVGGIRWQTVWEQVDLMFAVNWRYIIPPEVFERAHSGAYVFHDSLLPEYRGFSPTVWAIINGEDHTGVTLFNMVEDYDAGEIVGQERVLIQPDDTIAIVIERVTHAYLRLLEMHLPQLMAGNAPRIPQDESLVTYTCKLLPDDFWIDWNWPTERIYNLIRAVTAPYAGAYTYFEGGKLRIWKAEPENRRYVGRIPGRVVEFRPGAGAVVLTGDSALRLMDVQLDGEEIVRAGDLLNRLSYTLTTKP